VNGRRGTPQPFELGDEFSLEQPLDYEDARVAAREFASQRAEARRVLEDAYIRLADAERDYRQARQRARIAAPKVERGEVTAGDRDDYVDSSTSDQRRERDVAKYLIEITKERLEEIDATRASFHRLIEWSAKIDPAAQEDRSPAEDPFETLRRRALR
jgi:hypothetical protein